MPRLEKRYINQRTLALEIVFKAPIGPCASAERRVELDFREGEVYFIFSWFWAGFRPKLGPGTCPSAPAEKRYINQRALAREIDSKASEQLKSKIWL